MCADSYDNDLRDSSTFCTWRGYTIRPSKGQKNHATLSGFVGYVYLAGITYERKGMYEQSLEAYLKSKLIEGAKPEELSAFRTAYQKSDIRGYWRHVRGAVTRDGPETCSMTRIYARLVLRLFVQVTPTHLYRLAGISVPIGSDSPAKTREISSKLRAL
jgi:hypothetical protein